MLHASFNARILFPWLLATVLLAGSSPTSGRAADKVTKADLEKLLELGWSRVPATVAEADQLYTTLVERHAGDVSLEQAHLLFSLKQRRFEAAIQIADRLAVHPQQKLAALRMKAWLLIFTKQYEKAGSAMEKLAAALPAEVPPGRAVAVPGDKPAPAVNPVPGAPQLDDNSPESLAKFLGRLQGYLDGPVADQVPEPQRTDLRERLVARLAEPWRETFNQGREQVLQKFASLQQDKSQTLEKVQEAAERKRDDRLTELDQSRETAEQRAERLVSDARNLREDFTKRMSDIERRDAPLNRQMQNLNQQINQLTVRLQDTRASLAIENARAIAWERDERTRNLAYDFTRQRTLEQLVFNAQNNLDTVRGQWQVVANQRAQLAGEVERLKATTGQQLTAVEREQQGLKKQLQKDTAESNRLKKQDTSKPNGAVTAKATTAQALVTYETLLLDKLREELLESVAE
ncbi:MAG: hypothetical protein ACKOBW_09280 [Planctomycetota bacterium]